MTELINAPLWSRLSDYIDKKRVTLIFKDQKFIAGACTTSNQVQVSKLVGTEFVRMNDLPAGVHVAICASYKQKAIVCGNNSKCYSVTIDGKTGRIADTNHQHGDGVIIGFQDTALIFGGSASSSYFTERYDDTNDSWEIMNSNNVWGSAYYYASAVAFKDKVYSFGGSSFGTNIYVMDKDYEWKLHHQNLLNSRNGHKAIINGELTSFKEKVVNWSLKLILWIFVIL